MKVPTCPEHGSLMLDLARGLLDDVEVTAADEVRESCAQCAQWWNTTFSEAAVAQVDGAVTEAFASFSLPASRRRPWFAAAAAAVLAVGLGGAALLWQSPESPSSVAVQATDPGLVLSAWDFEEGEVEVIQAQNEPTPTSSKDADAAVFVSGLESGDLDSWTLHS